MHVLDAHVEHGVLGAEGLEPLLGIGLVLLEGFLSLHEFFLALLKLVLRELLLLLREAQFVFCLPKLHLPEAAALLTASAGYLRTPK